MLTLDYMKEGWEFPILQHPSALVGTDTELMPGSILCAGAILTVNIQAGMGLVVNLHTTVGHDCNLGAFVTLSPGCHLSGNVQLGDYVQMGTGAVVLPGIAIGHNTEVGAGAVVTTALPGHVVAIGVPARIARNR
jgi:sugar O-acyltransferase (sialic acid O-acetyltransferase NeuD family)